MWKKSKEETLALLCSKFLAVAVRGKVALIPVAAKVCLFSSLRSICLYNLIEGRFIFRSGYFPESSLKSISGPRRIADTEGP